MLFEAADVEAAEVEAVDVEAADVEAADVEAAGVEAAVSVSFGVKKIVVARDADAASETATAAAEHSAQLRLLGAKTADTERAARDPLDAGT